MAGHDEFFATVVRKQRETLGLTMLELKERGGPAVPTQVEAERGELRDNVRPSTFRKYDIGLGWVIGSAAAAYREGRQPVEAEPKPPDAFEPGATTVPLKLEQLLPLLDAQRELHAIAIAEPVTGLPSALDRLARAVATITGPFVTDILERNRNHQTHPLIEIAFADALSAPVSALDPDAEEKLYRRWLIGRADSLDDATSRRFEQRYQSRPRGET
ncbi:hypothetical protein [Nocardia nepalensis]|uniref:hypothetical protein n=1 Tax=Nocardia nepalensis TaxID=3375448 RepID=UPI003B682068